MTQFISHMSLYISQVSSNHVYLVSFLRYTTSDMTCRVWRALEVWLRGQSRSFKSHRSIVHVRLPINLPYSAILYHFRVITRWKYRDLEI